MNVKIVPFFRPAVRSRDWSNQELAEFYRVEASMIRSGLSVVTDRGLSDEGDPWFVFCRAETEDVIVHFARIDGCYVVASPAFDDCVRGHEFRPLIERLIESHPIVVPKAQNGRNIFIHPAALLVALVTTCFFKLGQTDAVAAEIKGAKLTVSPSGSSDHKETLRGTNPVFLDEQAASVVLAIIATASSWAATDVFNQDASAQAPQHSSSEAQSQTVAAEISSFLLSPLGNGAGAQTNSRALNASEPNDLAFSASDEAPPQIHSSAAGVSTIQKVLENEAVSTVVFQAPAVSHEAQAAELVFAPTSMAFIPQEAQTSNASLANGGAISSADQEVLSVLGDAIRTHLLEGQPSVEKNLVLTASSFQVASASSSQASAGETVPSAPAASEPVNGSVSTSTSVTAATVHKATAAEIDQAIYKFVAIHTDFLLFTVKNEVIIFDSHLTAGNMSLAEHQEFSYADGSMIFLIGLPASANSDSDIAIIH